MEDLIKALQIFLKYDNSRRPTLCADDKLIVNKVSRADVSEKDLEDLRELNFIWNDTEGYFFSFRFGSN